MEDSSFKKQRAYMYGGNDTVAVSLSMISFTTDLPSGWLYDKWR